LNCTICNKEIPNHSIFCLYCGSQVAQSQSNNTKRFRINPNLILSGALILAVMVVIVFLNETEQPNEIPNIETSENIQSNEIKSLHMAIDRLKEEVAKNPDDLNSNIQLANNLFDVKKFNEAIPYYKRVLKSDPNNVEIRIDLAVSYFNIENNDSALVQMKKALKINPNHPQGLFNMGVIYFNMKDIDKAKENWNKLIAQHDNTDIAVTAKQLLNNLQ